MKPALRRTLRGVLWFAAAIAIGVFVVRAFVGDVYYVDSSSMEPTLHGAQSGGDWVFVRYEDDPWPQRFDLGVITRLGEPEPLVKRIVGMPGETVQVLDGDLFVGGARLSAGAARPPLVELFDSRRDDFERAFNFAHERWKHTGDTWQLDAHGLRNALASWKDRLLDGYVAAGGQLVEGKRHVGDAALELDVRVEDGWSQLTLRVTEDSDLFELELAPTSPTNARARFLRHRSQETPEELARADVAWRAGEWHRLRWSNVDNQLEFRCDGRSVARAGYESNVPLKNVPDPGYQQLSPRVAFGGGELSAEFRAIRVARDLHWTALPSSRFGTDSPETLGPDEVFVLGDNSGDSVDSRVWGGVQLPRVIGKPLCVVWPPSRWRVLRPREEDSAP